MIRSTSTNLEITVSSAATAPAPASPTVTAPPAATPTATDDENKPINALEKMSKLVHQLSVSSSSIALNLSGYTSESATKLNEEMKRSSLALTIECMPKSKSMSMLNTIGKSASTDGGKPDEPPKEFKLVSPYGDWCAFSGGGGSGGCIITGPYEPLIMPKDEFSDESFESTEESDAVLDFTGPIGLTHNDFVNTEVVWAKRPALPWFPGILIDPYTITKEIKDLIKHLGANYPSKEELADQSSAVVNCRQNEKLFFIFLFNSKKTWVWLPESKLRPFCKENDKLFLESCPLLSTKYRKEMEKAYKKAKRFVKSHPKQPIMVKATK